MTSVFQRSAIDYSGRRRWQMLGSAITTPIGGSVSLFQRDPERVVFVQSSPGSHQSRDLVVA